MEKSWRNKLGRLLGKCKPQKEEPVEVAHSELSTWQGSAFGREGSHFGGDPASAAQHRLSSIRGMQQASRNPSELPEGQRQALLTMLAARPPLPNTSHARPAPIPLSQRIATDSTSGASTPKNTTPRGYQSNPVFDPPAKPSLLQRMDEAHLQVLEELEATHIHELAEAEAAYQAQLAFTEAAHRAEMAVAEERSVQALAEQESQFLTAQQKLAQRLMAQMAPVRREEAYKSSIKSLQAKLRAAHDAHERAARENAAHIAELQGKLRAVSSELKRQRHVQELTLASPGGGGSGRQRYSQLAIPGSPMGKQGFQQPPSPAPSSPDKQRYYPAPSPTPGSPMAKQRYPGASPRAGSPGPGSPGGKRRIPQSPSQGQLLAPSPASKSQQGVPRFEVQVAAGSVSAALLSKQASGRSFGGRPESGSSGEIEEGWQLSVERSRGAQNRLPLPTGNAM